MGLELAISDFPCGQLPPLHLQGPRHILLLIPRVSLSELVNAVEVKIVQRRPWSISIYQVICYRQTSGLTVRPDAARWLWVPNTEVWMYIHVTGLSIWILNLHYSCDSVKRSDVIGNRFEWELGEKKLYKTPLPHTLSYWLARWQQRRSRLLSFTECTAYRNKTTRLDLAHLISLFPRTIKSKTISNCRIPIT